MWHIPILRDDLQPLYRFRISDDIVKEDWSVLLDPMRAVSVELVKHLEKETYHGSS